MPDPLAMAPGKGTGLGPRPDLRPWFGALAWGPNLEPWPGDLTWGPELGPCPVAWPEKLVWGLSLGRWSEARLKPKAMASCQGLALAPIQGTRRGLSYQGPGWGPRIQARASIQGTDIMVYIDCDI